MSDILRRDRNANILKYVHSITCQACHGTRLNEDALSVTVHGKSIADIVTLELNELKTWIALHPWSAFAKAITEKIDAQITILEDLGVGHLTLDRSAKSLRSSEIQRIRVANQLLVPLSDVLYVFDEPSIGLHKEENERLLYHLKQLVQKGNTVIVVEHDLDTIRTADHIIEIGPKAGVHGGEVIVNGAFSAFSQQKALKEISPTYRAITNSKTNIKPASVSKAADNSIRFFGCRERNLKNIDVQFQLGKLNVVSGRSGVGKSSLVKDTLLKVVRQQLGVEIDETPKLTRHENLDAINKLIFIDHSPIGKTPRSNPATYLGLSDHIRDLYASLPESKKQGFTKSRFSFNNKGGRCETCQGAGKTQIGMHFLGNVDLVCGTCNGDRFNEETLQITYNE
jgi:excinuclease ABC subunit A